MFGFLASSFSLPEPTCSASHSDFVVFQPPRPMTAPPRNEKPTPATRQRKHVVRPSWAGFAPQSWHSIKRPSWSDASSSVRPGLLRRQVKLRPSAACCGRRLDAASARSLRWLVVGMAGDRAWRSLVLPMPTCGRGLAGYWGSWRPRLGAASSLPVAEVLGVDDGCGLDCRSGRIGLRHPTRSRAALTRGLTGPSRVRHQAWLV